MLTRFILTLTAFALTGLTTHAQEMRMADDPLTGTWLDSDQLYEEMNGVTHKGMYSWKIDDALVTFEESHDENSLTLYQENNVIEPLLDANCSCTRSISL